MKKQLLTIALLLFCGGAAFAQTEEVATFKFVPGDDMFYIPWEGNDVQLNALYALVDKYRAEISAGQIPIYVDSYSSSMRDNARNSELAFIRANRVKSELIIHKGLAEENFVTKNYTTAFIDADGTVHKDMVVVTLRIPQVEALPPAMPAPKPEPEYAPEPVVEQKPEPAVRFEPPVVEPSAKPYCFAVRTNLLYDAFLLPTLGIEWRVNRDLGIKLDGSLAWWGSADDKIQRIWLVSPEVRWYMGASKRFYLGLGGNYGKYNTYGYLLGKLYPDNTGYQGKLYGGGLTVGYQARLARHLSLDLNLGLGVTRLEYDSFYLDGGIRTYDKKDQAKNFWGPTQAGVSLVWTFGQNK